MRIYGRSGRGPALGGTDELAVRHRQYHWRATRMDEGGGGKDAEFARAIEGRESSWRRWRGVTNARVGSEYWQWWFDGRRKWIKIRL